MNERKIQTRYIADPEERQEILNNPKYIVTHQTFATEDVVRMNYIVKEEFLTQTQNCNVILGSFVTAYARLRLFELLEQLQDRVLYFDTGWKKDLAIE